MQIKTSLLLLATLAIATTGAPIDNKRSSDDEAWLETPSGQSSGSGFGGRTALGGKGISYAGNLGTPWGSNIIEISENDAKNYQNVMQFKGDNTDPWTVVFWNKMGPDGQMDGWYGHSALSFELAPGETKYVAVDEDSRGGFGAAKGNKLPTDGNGGYACTWGEFDFGSSANGGWSGFDVSMIQAQNAGEAVQGMQMCEARGGQTCSAISQGGAKMNNAYSNGEAALGGVGGNIPGGPVRLAVTIAYSG